MAQLPRPFLIGAAIALVTTAIGSVGIAVRLSQPISERQQSHSDRGGNEHNACCGKHTVDLLRKQACVEQADPAEPEEGQAEYQPVGQFVSHNGPSFAAFECDCSERSNNGEKYGCEGKADFHASNLANLRAESIAPNAAEAA